MFTPEQVALLLGAVVVLFLAVLAGLTVLTRAKFIALAKNTESDTIKSRATALKEMQEVDGIKFVFRIAEQSVNNNNRIYELEKNLIESQKRIETLTNELISKTKENTDLQEKIIRLELMLNGSRTTN